MAKTVNVGRMSLSFAANTVHFMQQLKNAERKTATSAKKMGGDFEKVGKKAKKMGDGVKKGAEEIGLLGKAAGIAKSPIGLVTGAVIALTTAMLNASAQYATLNKHLRALGETSGVTAEQMRKQAFTFRETGLGAEQMAEIFKDIKDKVGEFAAVGTGVFEDFHMTLGETRAQGMRTAQMLQHMAGSDVLEYMTQRMKEANVPMAQMTFVLESVANNSARMSSALSGQSKQVEELTRKYEELAQAASSEDLKAYEDMASSWDLFWQSFGAVSTEILAPVYELLTDIIDGMTSILPDTDETEAERALSRKRRKADRLAAGEKDPIERERIRLKMMQEEFARVENLYKLQRDYHDKGVAQGRPRLINHDAEDLETIGVLYKKIGDEINTITKRIIEMSEADKQFKAKQTKELSKIAISTGVDTGQDKRKVYEQRIKNAKAVAKAELKNFEDTYKDTVGGTEAYEQARNRIILKNSNAIKSIRAEEVAYFDKLQQDSLAKKAELENKRKALNEIGLKDIEKNTIAYLNKQERLELNKVSSIVAGKLGLEEEAEAAKLRIAMKYEEEKRNLMNSMGIGVKDEDALEQELTTIREKHEAEMVELQAYKELKLIDVEDFELRKKAIEDRYRREKIKAEENAYAKQAKEGVESINALGVAMQNYGDVSTGVAKAGFAISKGAAVGEALINAQLAFSAAWTDTEVPWYVRATNAISALGTVMGAVASIRSTNADAQAHGGMDNIPNSLNNSTFVLKAGERVIQPEANKDLTSFLSESKGSTGNVTVDYHVEIKGNVTDKAWFTEVLMKNKEEVAAAVAKVQKERPLNR